MAKVYVGTVTMTYYKGWGSIGCDSTKNLFGNEVFLPRLAWDGYLAKVGDQVKFTIIRGEGGCLQAANVQPCTTQQSARPSSCR